MKKHRLVGLGGSFDHFHAGHEFFLRFCAAQGEKLLIGVTHPKLTLHKPFADTIEPYARRVNNVITFCRANKISHEVSPLHDVYGPTLTNKYIGAVCVTEETVSGGQKINQARRAARMHELPIYICSMLLSEQKVPLSAEDIRGGLVNRSGVVYALHYLKDILVTEEQKNELRKPLGRVINNKAQIIAGAIKKANISKKNDGQQKSFRALVGDITLQFFRENKLRFDLGVFDGRTARAEIVPRPFINEKSLKTVNPAGHLTKNLFETLQQAINTQEKFVFVEGEEDLATAALILLLPLESQIYYGQQDKGQIIVRVTEALKEKIYHLLYA